MIDALVHTEARATKRCRAILMARAIGFRRRYWPTFKPWAFSSSPEAVAWEMSALTAQEGERTMDSQGIRWGWLKGMYIYSAIIASVFGLGILFVPDMMISIFKLPPQEPIMFGITGGADLAVGLCCILALVLRAPLRYAPVLLFQMTYKVLWSVFVVLPFIFRGELQGYGWFFFISYLTFIIGDVIALPFPHLFSKGESVT